MLESFGMKKQKSIILFYYSLLAHTHNVNTAQGAPFSQAHSHIIKVDTIYKVSVYNAYAHVCVYGDFFALITQINKEISDTKMSLRHKGTVDGRKQ